jgi:uncharacterized protein (DUF433 family)
MDPTEERIVLDPTVLAGKPVVRGTRISVEHVIGLLAQGWSPAEILQNHPNLTAEDVAAAASVGTFRWDGRCADGLR